MRKKELKEFTCTPEKHDHPIKVRHTRELVRDVKYAVPQNLRYKKDWRDESWLQ